MQDAGRLFMSERQASRAEGVMKQEFAVLPNKNIEAANKMIYAVVKI